MRISNNQVVGAVHITDEGNPGLIDRTSREGLVDGPPLSDLSALTRAGMSILEEERFRARRGSRTARTHTSDSRDGVLEIIRATAQASQTGPELRASVRALEKAHRDREKHHRRRHARLTHLAGFGLAAKTVTESTARTLDSAITSMHVVANRLRVEGVSPELLARIAILEQQHSLLQQQIEAIMPRSRAEVQRAEELDVQSTANEAAQLLLERWREKGMRFKSYGDGPLVVSMNREHLMQVFLCLYENALTHASDPESSGRELHVCVRSCTPKPSIVVADNGPGVLTGDEESMFGGHSIARGLGLHVVRELLGLYEARIEAMLADQLLPGANFLISFKPSARGSASERIELNVAV